MRRVDEKTIGIDLIVHSELKRICKVNKIQMKDAVMTALTNFLTKTKNHDRIN